MGIDSSSHDKVRDAQRKIIDQLVDIEKALAALYDKYSHQFPEYGELWGVLADEERGHAAVLNQLHGLLDSGHIFQGIGRFSPATLDPVRRFIADEMKLAPTRSAKDAASNAIRLETSLIEAHFYDVVNTGVRLFFDQAADLSLEERQAQKSS